MSAPYRNFWIIVGMTVGAIVFANGTSKPTRSPVPEVSNNNQPISDKQSESATTKIPGSLPEIEAALPESLTSVSGTEAKQVASQDREMRDIEPDFRKAFDQAVQISLTNSPVESLGQSENEQTDTQPTVPSLETKEVRSTPTVFDIQKAEPEAGPLVEMGIGTGKTTTNLNVREGPGPKYILLDTLGSGVSLVILAEENGWMHVRVSETGREGWVNKTYLLRD